MSKRTLKTYILCFNSRIQIKKNGLMIHVKVYK